MKQSKKQKPTSRQRTIDQLEFIIQPLSITFTKQQSTQYYVYIEKGAQVLGKVDEIINGKRNTHVFSKSHNKSFRVANDKNLTYQWSIYKFTNDYQQQYLQSIQFNIKAKYVEYLLDLQQRETDLYRIYLQKQKKKEIQQIWRDLRCDLTHNQMEMSCKFVKLNAIVTFKLLIKCDLDYRVEKWEEEKEIKRLARTVNNTRKGSTDSRNKISELSFYQSKEKIPEVNINNQHQKQTFLQSTNILSQQSRQNAKKSAAPQTKTAKNSSLNVNSNQLIEQTLCQSQIRVTNPEGQDVTDQIPQKFLNHKPTNNPEYYYRKKSSMLSDIIEESYQGSSNVITKSNQGERLKSVDEIHEEEDVTPLFSPLIKTQNYDPQKDQEYFDRIKRTTTLVQRPSQQFQLELSPKSTPKRMSHYYPNVEPRNQLKPIDSKQKEQLQMSISDTKISSSRKSSFSQQQQNQIVKDLIQERRNTIKNVIKVVVILFVLIFVINSLGLFDQSQRKSIGSQKKKYTKSQTKIESVNKKDQNIKGKISKG